ncbi:unnamed protein product [Fusarium graminearum]|nr:unnamed protein product [Fusarium graminearum]CAG1967023.1 unnamed protein product [Fusarium graminearum]CZS83411.1 unnamed protein product [Fusarium graminearum]
MAKGANKWAVLVGIDFYGDQGGSDSVSPPPNIKSSHPVSYNHLQGCVNDVVAVREYLINTLKVQPDNITTLLAPRPDHNYTSLLPKHSKPTYLNLVRAFQKPQGAEPGYLIYIHYSGHGARATTVFQDVKATDALDEALVPSDINHSACYLRDLELGYLLHQMANDGLVVTAVLDCCHSGGAVRGDEDSQLGLTRSIPEVYRSNPESDRPLTNTKSDEWSSWLKCWSSGQHGFFSLAACQEEQTAREKLGTGTTYGLLTYWLLKILNSSSMKISSQSLYSRIIDCVQDDNRHQTPHYVGDSNRSFASNELRSPIYSLTVTTEALNPNKDLEDQRLCLNGGLIHGVQRDSVYTILKSHEHLTQDVRDIQESNILARVRVTEVDTGQCWASFLEMDNCSLSEIKGGCPAVLQTLPISKTCKVCLDISDGMTNTIMEEWKKNNGDRYWLSLVESDANFTITIDKDNNFLISDDDGEFDHVVKAATRPIPITDTSTLIRRLQHLARLRMTKRLANPDVNSDCRLIDVSIKPVIIPENKKHQFQAADVKETAPGTFEVQESSYFTIRIRNCSSRALGCVILDCTSELSVQRIFPREEPFYKLKPNSHVDISTAFLIKSDLHQNLIKSGIPIVDCIKVFACSPERDLDSLRLESLLVSERSSGPLSSPFLDGLLHDLDTRRFGLCVDFSAAEPDWDTEDIKFHVTPVGDH